MQENRPSIPSPEQLWTKYEEQILEVLESALLILKTKTPLALDEPKLNLELYFSVRQANHRLISKGRGTFWLPVWEGQNQPVNENEIENPNLKKKPDFQWQIFDDNEVDSSKAWKHYTIECKRLGSPSTRTWNFNEEYIIDGVLRFIREDFGYGQYTSSGAMVGYIQSMDIPDIFEEVNFHAGKKLIAFIDQPSRGWQNGGVTKMDQHILRKTLMPHTFKIRHLWIDLRE